MSELDGLFSAEVPKTAAKAAEGKRVKLLTGDRVPAQFLERASISQVNSKELWSVVEAGHKKAAFLHELAAGQATGGEARIGIGLSRVAEAVQKGIAELEHEKMPLLLKPEPLEKALAEAKLLKPILDVLNGGKAQAEQVASVGALKRKRESKAAPTPAQVEKAASEFHAFLSREKSALFSMLNILSGDGDFFVAYCHLKTARAWTECGGGSRDKAVAAAKARHSGGPDLAGPAVDDSRGLFE
ncbi:unnamed protein product [Effrenium voratum]|nr:unnamed protein product [Effrenium voratum]